VFHAADSRRVALHGSYFDDNFGDLLLLKIFERWVRARGDEPVFPFVPRRRRSTFAREFPGRAAGLGRSAPCRALVFAGGGFFAEPEKERRTWRRHWNLRFLKRHVLVAELCVLAAVPFALSNAASRAAARRMFNRAAVIVVRNEESRSFIEDTLGVKRDIRVAPDPVLTIAREDIPPEFRAAAQGLLEKYRGARFLGIHHPSDFLQDHPSAALVRRALGEELARPEAGGIVPVVFADHGRGAAGPSERLAAEIRSATGRPCLAVPFEGLWQTLALVSELSAVVTSKLHVGIVSYAFGIPAESFATHSKTPRFYRQVGHPSVSAMMRGVGEEEARRKIARAIAAARNGSVPDGGRAAVIEAARQNRAELDAFLDSTRRR
jgi:polysaccharide pyruvyl transferase WcaK-like protein